MGLFMPDIGTRRCGLPASISERAKIFCSFGYPSDKLFAQFRYQIGTRPQLKCYRNTSKKPNLRAAKGACAPARRFGFLDVFWCSINSICMWFLSAFNPIFYCSILFTYSLFSFQLYIVFLNYYPS